MKNSVVTFGFVLGMERREDLQTVKCVERYVRRSLEMGVVTELYFSSVFISACETVYICN